MIVFNKDQTTSRFNFSDLITYSIYSSSIFGDKISIKFQKNTIDLKWLNKNQLNSVKNIVEKSITDNLEIKIKRNEYLITSHHALRETLIAQTGFTEQTRRGFLQDAYNCATLTMGSRMKWEPTKMGIGVF